MNEHSIAAIPRHYTEKEITALDKSPQADELRKLREALDKVNEILKELKNGKR
ncbi:MAG: hypothetical protein RDU25_00760 [Patescibacteria group bacterium]|nr:hypothetical protein [Patescibacteria group bacterium]